MKSFLLAILMPLISMNIFAEECKTELNSNDRYTKLNTILGCLSTKIQSLETELKHLKSSGEAKQLQVEPPTTPIRGLVLYEDNRIKIEITGSSRNNGHIILSLLASNKTASTIRIAGAFGGKNYSILTDEKGTVCKNTSFSGFTSLADMSSGVYEQGTQINAGGKKIFGLDTSGNCSSFTGKLFNYDTSIWLYDDATAKTSLVTFGFIDLAIPE